jgi:hypothetical protein
VPADDTPERIVLPDTEKPPATASHKDSAPGRDVPSEIAAQLRAYVDGVWDLRDIYKAGRARNAPLQAVLRNPDDYVGKLLRSQAYLVSAYGRGVSVSLQPGKPGDWTLIPYTLRVGQHAETLCKGGFNRQAVVIIYGVVSPSNLTLFEIEALARQGRPTS